MSILCGFLVEGPTILALFFFSVLNLVLQDVMQDIPGSFEDLNLAQATLKCGF